ncbi:MAG: hypothetical protein AABX85_03235 [Nanoarchaeota archaeon]
MKIEVNIEKRYFFVIIGAILLLGGIIVVYAGSGNIPNPGHPLSTIEGYFVGDSNLNQSFAKLCLADGTNCMAQAEKQYCNSVNTGPNVALTGYYEISMLKDGRNICEDNNGCTYRIWRYRDDYPAGFDFYTSYPVMFRQTSAGNWLDSAGNQVGINGDKVQKSLFSDWGNSALYDDQDGWLLPKTKDGLTFRDYSAGTAFLITICDY